MIHKTEKLPEDHSGNNIIELRGELGVPTDRVTKLALEFVTLEAAYEEARKKAAELYKELTRCEVQLYDSLYDADLSQNGFMSTEFGVLRCKNRVEAKIVDFEAISAWLKENNMFDEIFKYTPRRARINELVKQYLEEGKQLPPGVDYTPIKTIGHTKS